MTNKMPDEVWVYLQNGDVPIRYWDYEDCPMYNTEREQYTRTDLVIRKDDAELDKIEKALDSALDLQAKAALGAKVDVKALKRDAINHCIFDSMANNPNTCDALQVMEGAKRMWDYLDARGMIQAAQEGT